MIFCAGQGTRDLQLHVSNGVLYVLGHDDCESIRQFSPDDNLAALLKDIDRCFIFGFRENASLITRLYEHFQKGTSTVLYIGSPTPTAAKNNPDATVRFRQMERLPFGSGGNGWHRAMPHDDVIYRFVQAVPPYDPDVHWVPPPTDEAQQLLEQHPAWPVINYLGGDRHAAGRLLAWIIDPRWFYNPGSGRIAARLGAALGVDGSGSVVRIQHILDNPDTAWRIYQQHFHTVSDVLDAWTGKIDISVPVLPENELNRPHNFLWRMLLFQYEKTGSRGLAIAGVCRYFLDFLVSVWLSRIAPHRELFVPKYFWAGEPETVADWLNFCAQTSRKQSS